MFAKFFFKIPQSVYKLSPPRIIAISFIVAIFFGAVILNLPISSSGGKSIGIINALFTSTSAFCVTGLTVSSTYLQWSLFGKIALLIFVQIGGLGITTIYLWLLVFIGRKITLKERIVIQQSLNQDNPQGMVS